MSNYQKAAFINSLKQFNFSKYRINQALVALSKALAISDGNKPDRAEGESMHKMAVDVEKAFNKPSAIKKSNGRLTDARDLNIDTFMRAD